MRAVAVSVLASSLVVTAAEQREPIIDVHMHALAANAQGPPPLAMCTPFPEYAVWDPATAYRDVFLAKLKKPTCSDPIWSPGDRRRVDEPNARDCRTSQHHRCTEWAGGARRGVGQGQPA